MKYKTTGVKYKTDIQTSSNSIVNGYMLQLKQYDDIIFDEFGIKIGEGGRQSFAVDLRRIFFKFVRNKFPQLSLAFIGSYLNKDHATVLHALRSYDNLYLSDTDFKKLADHLRLRFRTIDSESPSEEYLIKLTTLINNSSEALRKEFYELIATHRIIKNNIDKVENILNNE
tara:strand:- start:5398 stop:5910 length:513 start_codon:yes stop_codon:yes gene_type:complete